MYLPFVRGGTNVSDWDVEKGSKGEFVLRGGMDKRGQWAKTILIGSARPWLLPKVIRVLYHCIALRCAALHRAAPHCTTAPRYGVREYSATMYVLRATQLPVQSCAALQSNDFFFFWEEGGGFALRLLCYSS